MTLITFEQARLQSLMKRIGSRLPSAGAGLILGVLGSVTGHRMNLTIPQNYFHPHYITITCGLLGMLLGLTRLRGLVWAASAFLTLSVLVVGYTPLMRFQADRWIRHDPLRPCPGVVALSADVFSDGTLNSTAHDRLWRALELLKEGYADHLVVTQSAPPAVSGMPTVRKRVKMVGLKVPVHEVGPVSDTHDEAVAVAELARKQGWKEVILVTSHFHTRRAAAVFEKAGLRVVVQPARETEYEMGSLIFIGDRIPAFRDWIKEVIGWQIYRRRGWI